MKTSPHPPMFRRALALLLCCLVAASCWALPASAQETEPSPAPTKETAEEPAVLDEDAPEEDPDEKDPRQRGRGPGALRRPHPFRGPLSLRQPQPFRLSPAHRLPGPQPLSGAHGHAGAHPHPEPTPTPVPVHTVSFQLAGGKTVEVQVEDGEKLSQEDLPQDTELPVAEFFGLV